MTTKTSRSALIIVDVQYDFLPGGSLGVTDGDQIIRPITELILICSPIIVTRDWHPENHFSFSEDPTYSDGSWPPHCIQGTRGAKIFPALRKHADFVISKGMNRSPPDAYSAFAGKTLRPVESLQEILHRSPIDQVIVTGLALDYCVKFTALDANALGYSTLVPLGATKGIASDSQTLEQFGRAGVQVVDAV